MLGGSTTSSSENSGAGKEQFASDSWLEFLRNPPRL